jgi:hypothetical protein
MEGKFPPGLNIRLINGEAQPDALRPNGKNLKLVYIMDKLPPKHKDAFGYAIPEHCGDGNGIRYGECFVGMEKYQNALVNLFDDDYAEDESTPPYTFWDVTGLLWLTSLHEPCHLMGLVSPSYLRGSPGMHNRNLRLDINNPNPESIAPFVMNVLNDITIKLADGYYSDLTKAFYPVQFKALNKAYLKFVLPTPNPGN